MTMLGLYDSCSLTPASCIASDLAVNYRLISLPLGILHSLFGLTECGADGCISLHPDICEVPQGGHPVSLAYVFDEFLDDFGVSTAILR